MKISIPEPCHQNWGAMTPNQQGRFCQSCQKTVVDFTQFSTTDIQNYFAKHFEQKVCGRFKNEQLTQIDINIPSYVFKYISAPKKFALALLLVFGTTLFSCTDNNGNSANIGKVAIIDTITNVDTLLKNDAIIIENNPTKPSTKIIEEQIEKDKTQGEVEAYPTNEIMCDTIYEEPIKQESIKGKVKINNSNSNDKTTDNKTIITTMGLVAPDFKIDSTLINKLPEK